MLFKLSLDIGLEDRGVLLYFSFCSLTYPYPFLSDLFTSISNITSCERFFSVFLYAVVRAQTKAYIIPLGKLLIRDINFVHLHTFGNPLCCLTNK